MAFAPLGFSANRVFNSGHDSRRTIYPTHSLLPQIIGALLARFYFWKKYGKQQWRQYAMVLAVGFGVGMSLIGMFCAALAMISKSVSSLQY